MPLFDASSGVGEFLTAFADDEHLIGSHHAWWIGIAPFLEEDLAFCSIAQDELGHALALYDLVTDDIDQFALRRDRSAYRSCDFVEMVMPDWADTLVRHWLYDTAEHLRWEALADSSSVEVRGIAARALTEESFHVKHARLMVSRSVQSEQARNIVIDSLQRLLPHSATMWASVAGEAEALTSGVTTMSSEQLAEQYAQALRNDVNEWGLDVPIVLEPTGQSHRLERHHDFDDFYASLNLVMDLDPTANW